MTPDVSYWEWAPTDTPDGVYDTPHFGELVPGRVVEVRPTEVPLVQDDPNFKKSTKKAFEGQLSIHEEHARLAQPDDPEEE